MLSSRKDINIKIVGASNSGLTSDMIKPCKDENNDQRR